MNFHQSVLCTLSGEPSTMSTPPLFWPPIALPPLPLFGKHPFLIHDYILQTQTKQSRVHISLICLVTFRCPRFLKGRHQKMRAEP